MAPVSLPFYFLFSLLSATEQSAMCPDFIFENVRLMEYIVWAPPNAGDWLNLVQFTVARLGRLFLNVSSTDAPRCLLQAL